MTTSETQSGTRVACVLLVNSLLLGLATIATAIRFLTRGLYLKVIGLDDRQLTVNPFSENRSGNHD